MDKLIGEIIQAVIVFSDYHDHIQFVTHAGPIAYGAFGDCCSSSFFSDIFGVDKILNKKITEVKNIDLEPGEAPSRGASEDDNEAIYGIRIFAGDDACTIIFRNHSNGYYGGYIMDSQPMVSTETKQWDIKKDWSAPSL